MTMERVYIINVNDVFSYLDNHGIDEEEMMRVIMTMDEDTCKELVEKSRDDYSEGMTIEQFESDFNYDPDGVYNSDKYYLRFF